MPSGGRWEGGGGGVKILGGSHGFREMEGESVVAEVYGKDWRKLNDN